MKLKKYFASGWYLYLTALLAMITVIALNMVSPLITKSLIDDVITNGRSDMLNGLLLGLLAIGFSNAILQFIKEYLIDVASVKIGSEIRIDLFRHIQKLSVDFFDKNNTGELMARIKDDVDNVWNALGYVGMLVAECSIHTVCMVICMVGISPLLTLIPLVIMPFAAWRALSLEKNISKVFDDLSEENAHLTTVAQENLSGVRVVKAFAREEYEAAKFSEHNKNYYDLSMKQSMIDLKYSPNISFLTRVMLILIVLAGGMMVVYGQITLGDLAAFTDYANNIIWPLEMVGWLCSDAASAAASAGKIRKIWREPPSLCDSAGAVSIDRAKGHITFKNVSLNISGTQVLDDISFDLPAGKTIGIMGVTGSGKTSIVNLLERFYDVNSGEIMLDDVNIKDITLQSLRKNLAVVNQDVFLFSDSINENISIGQRKSISKEQIESAAAAACAAGFIEKLTEKYDTVVGERGVGLSGGQKQRISIARALAKKAPVLILDDFTSALDAETEHEVLRTILSMKDTTKIIIAHRVFAVMQADEIIVLNGGKIAERGTHDELIKINGIYRETYDAQALASDFCGEVM